MEERLKTKSDNHALNLSEIEESGLTLTVCTNTFSPRKTDLYYNKELRLERLLILNILSEYVRRGKSVLKPVKCLDAGNGVGINGLLWQKYVPGDIKVSVTTPHSTAVDTVIDNTVKNGLSEVEVLNKDLCVLLHQEAFNFIHIDCHTEASHYFDAAFKNLPRNGVLVITTKDDNSLYGRNPDAALRSYGGVITKTSYGTELAIRLVIAAMAKSAAKYSKAINVICCASFKNAFMIAITSTKGPLKASKTYQDIRRLLHCNMCEERVFYPITDGFVIENPASLLSCKCVTSYPGKVVMELGPFWAGEIFDADYLNSMMQDDNIPSRELLNSFISQLVAETLLPTAEQITKTNVDKPPPNKILKLDDQIANGEYEIPITPPFYYNLPRYSPKGPHLMPIDKVVQALNKAGYKANRTHFDREAVRTSANAFQLIEVIKNCLEKRK